MQLFSQLTLDVKMHKPSFMYLGDNDAVGGPRSRKNGDKLMNSNRSVVEPGKLIPINWELNKGSKVSKVSKNPQINMNKTNNLDFASFNTNQKTE